MPWTFESSLSYLDEKRKLPLWRRRHISERESLIKEGKLNGTEKGKRIQYPLPGLGNAIIAKKDEKSHTIEFQHIQIQT